MLGESTGKLLSQVPLSKDSSTRRIHHIAGHLNYQLMEEFKGKKFWIHVHEATDIKMDAHLICYSRFIDGYDIVEDPFCKMITASTKTQDLFEILDTIIVGSGLVSVLIVVVRCPVVTEDCRCLFKAQLLIHCGPITLITEKHYHQSIWAYYCTWSYNVW